MKIGTIAAALVGGIVMFGLGFLFFGVLLTSYFQTSMTQYPGLMKDPPAVWAIFLFNLVWAWLVAWFVDRSNRGGWAEGAKAGAIILFAIGLGMDLDYLAFMNVFQSFAPILVHLLVVTVMGGIAGAVIGLVLDFFSKR